MLSSLSPPYGAAPASSLNREYYAYSLIYKYSENSDNSTDKGGSLPLANYIILVNATALGLAYPATRQL